MNPQQNNTHPLKSISWMFLAFAFVGLAFRTINIGNPLNDHDDALYALIARSLLSGQLPYHGVYDHKPIALYYIFALFIQIFGYTLSAVRLMPFAAIGLTTWLLYRIAVRHLPPRLHFLSLCAIVCSWLPAKLWQWGPCERYRNSSDANIRWLVACGIELPAIKPAATAAAGRADRRCCANQLSRRFCHCDIYCALACVAVVYESLANDAAIIPG